MRTYFVNAPQSFLLIFKIYILVSTLEFKSIEKRLKNQPQFSDFPLELFGVICRY
jgi:hypothetical protein